MDVPTVVHLWTLDGEKMTGRNQHGHVIALRPFMGVMGMPPDEPGRHSTSPPRVWGGNMDCKELVAGLVVDLRITQIVNGVKGVHAVLPHGAIRKA